MNILIRTPIKVEYSKEFGIEKILFRPNQLDSIVWHSFSVLKPNL